jgi:hypothetical protein
MRKLIEGVTIAAIALSMATGGSAQTAPTRAEVHILNAGHFALYDKPDEIAGLLSDFLRHTIGGRAAVK